MIFYRSEPFTKEFSKLPEHIKLKALRQLKNLATYGVTHPGLSVRKMASLEVNNIWEARIDYHYRFTFELDGDKVYLRHVGTHEIYRKP